VEYKDNNKDTERLVYSFFVEEERSEYSPSSTGMRTRLLSFNIKISRGVYTLSKVEKMSTACSVVMMNLLSCLKKNHTLAYSRNTSLSKRTNKWNKRYNKNSMSTYKVGKAVETLIEKGYVTERRGIAHPDKERRIISEIHPTQKFVDKFMCEEERDSADKAYAESMTLLMLRDKETKREVEYAITDETEAMERVVREINLINAQHTFTTHYGEILDNSKAVRIFSGSMNKGGRYYHNDVLNIKQRSFVDGRLVVKPVEDTRLGMKIDGESVVEVDFSCLHPMLLLDIEGEDKTILKGDVYSAMLSPQQLTNPANRHLMKLSTNFMLNAESDAQAQRTVQGEMNKARGAYDVHSAAQVVATIKGTLLPVAHYFCSPDCTGLWLQYLDSKIMERVFKDFVAMHKPVVSVHDSALVKRQDAQVLVDSMARAYRAVVAEETGDEDRAQELEVYMKMNLPDGSIIHITA
jgi:hypothetical protein